LTPTERRILALLAQGLTNRRIGTRLGYAESTVKNHVSRILAKLEVSRRTEAAAYLVNHGKPSTDTVA
jgi:DNA-binding NarL/FixJ family response regulator